MSELKTCAVIGATPATLPFGYDEEHYDAITLKKKIAETMLSLIEKGVCEFVSTLSEGVELWSAEVCQAIRDAGSPLGLTCVPIGEEQANRWYPSVRERYFSLLERCGAVVNAKISDEQKSDTSTRRAAETAFCDDYILSHADVILLAGEPDERASRIESLARAGGLPVIRV